MRNLTVDIGNSAVKTAVFNNRELLHAQRWDNAEQVPFTEIIKDYNITNSIMCSVAENAAEAEEQLRTQTSYTRFTTAVHAGLNSLYHTPETLGLDRWAAAIALHSMYEGSAALAIDAGTCITTDAVDAAGTYLGGSISPGVDMRFKAMHEYTGRLPLAPSAVPDDVLADGRSTMESLRRGVWFGVLKETEGYISHYAGRLGPLHVVFTGGNGEEILKLTAMAGAGSSMVYDAALVHRGLNEVLLKEKHD